MEILWWIEDSWLGMLVSSSQWGYPIVLSLHAVGMAVLVGVSLILAMRVLGFGSAIPVTALAPFWTIALVGFVVNLLSGAALFMGNASVLFFNTAFHIKLIGVAVGLALTWWLVKICVRVTGEVSASHKGFAGVALLAWAVALVAGRLIGYFS
jgi:hypothetical protein